MYLIIASQVDDDAKELLPHFSAGSVRLVTPRDLSRPGWHYCSRDPSDTTGVFDGAKYYSTTIKGVLTRLNAIWSPELVHIADEDREYVAAETTAFLKFWLSNMPCPVINPPTGGSLSGPKWRKEQWLWAAREVGIPIAPYSRGTRSADLDVEEFNSMVEITLVGGQCLLGVESELVTMTRSLAESLGIALLSAKFVHKKGHGYVLIGANPIPRLFGSRSVELMIDYFERNGVMK